jgi:hypothetical protein
LRVRLPFCHGSADALLAFKDSDVVAGCQGKEHPDKLPLHELGLFFADCPHEIAVWGKLSFWDIEAAIQAGHCESQCGLASYDIGNDLRCGW